MQQLAGHGTALTGLQYRNDCCPSNKIPTSIPFQSFGRVCSQNGVCVQWSILCAAEPDIKQARHFHDVALSSIDIEWLLA